MRKFVVCLLVICNASIAVPAERPLQDMSWPELRRKAESMLYPGPTVLCGDCPRLEQRYDALVVLDAQLCEEINDLYWELWQIRSERRDLQLDVAAVLASQPFNEISKEILLSLLSRIAEIDTQSQMLSIRIRAKEAQLTDVRELESAYRLQLAECPLCNP